MNYKQALNNLSISRLKNLSRQTLGQRNNSAMPAVALVAGLAIGAALSVLFAPKKGEETRALIADGANDLSDSMMRKFKDAKKRFVKSGLNAPEIKDQAVTDIRKKTKKTAEKLAASANAEPKATEIKVS